MQPEFNDADKIRDIISKFEDKEIIDQREMIGMVKYHDIQGAEYFKVNKKE